MEGASAPGRAETGRSGATLGAANGILRLYQEEFLGNFRGIYTCLRPRACPPILCQGAQRATSGSVTVVSSLVHSSARLESLRMGTVSAIIVIGVGIWVLMILSGVSSALDNVAAELKAIRIALEGRR